jgi:sugar phosphate isomerase/epimerase
MYSLSTCWNSHRHTDGRAMLREIRDLGFEYAELSHGITMSLVPGIIEAVDAGELHISSLHNFCPLPLGVTRPSPNLYQCSSPSAREVAACWKHSLKTLEFAERMRARAVVLHLGSVDMRDYTGKLTAELEQGRQHEEKYQRLCMEAGEKREAKQTDYVRRSMEFLGRLVPEAERRGLALGIENRQAIEEIPWDTDLPAWFERFHTATVVYWHDCGHAQIKENLGFISHVMQLETLQDRLGGLHIHDVKFPGDDHRAPGAGTVDFAALKPFIKAGQIKVFELSPRLSADEVRRGVDHVRSLWAEAHAAPHLTHIQHPSSPANAHTS